MGDLFWNKIFGALLATALIVIGIKELGHALIHPHEPHEPGYKIAVASEGDAGKAVEVVEEVSLAQLLSEANATSGERVAKKCAACHDFSQGGPNKIGPNLWNIVGAQTAANDGFGYSPAMQAFGGTWDYETLNAFLSNPKATISGTAMSFAGLKKPKDAANILAYLRSLSDTPVALPALPVVTSEITDAAADGGANADGNGLLESIKEAVVDGAEEIAGAVDDGAGALGEVLEGDKAPEATEQPTEEPKADDH